MKHSPPAHTSAPAHAHSGLPTLQAGALASAQSTEETGRACRIGLHRPSHCLAAPALLPYDVSDVAGRLGPAVFDGGLERGVVAVVLVGVFLGEVGDRL